MALTKFSFFAALLAAFSIATSWAGPVVEFETSLGTIVAELDEEKAPKTVENFVKYVKDGHYNGVAFHRVIDEFMIQTGGFKQMEDGRLEQVEVRDSIQNEANNGLKNTKGTLAMARTSDPHSASAQFFINLDDNDFLNHTAETQRGWGYAVFGKVIEGMDVVDKIGKVETGVKNLFPRYQGQVSERPMKDVPNETVLIKSAKIR